MILGVGTDLVEVARIEAAMKRFGGRFEERLLTSGELEYCRSQGRAAETVAARFAAKEAVAKALGTGIGAELGWQDIEIVRLPSGQPLVRLQGKGADLLLRRNVGAIHLSLSHTRGLASAVVVLER